MVIDLTVHGTIGACCPTESRYRPGARPGSLNLPSVAVVLLPVDTVMTPVCCAYVRTRTDEKLGAGAAPSYCTMPEISAPSCSISETPVTFADCTSRSLTALNTRRISPGTAGAWVTCA